jgi:hypothetical protein
MPLFQISVLKKHLKQQDQEVFFKAEIDKTNREIDHMVYELYRLTEEEIKIVKKGY